MFISGRVRGVRRLRGTKRARGYEEQWVRSAPTCFGNVEARPPLLTRHCHRCGAPAGTLGHTHRLRRE